jgi:hypothetical protein
MSLLLQTLFETGFVNLVAVCLTTLSAAQTHCLAEAGLFHSNY